MRADLVRVGAVLLIGVVLLMVGLQFLQARFAERDYYLLKVRFSDARNISEGASVLMAGVRVGTVRKVALVGTPPKAELTLAIRKSVRIPEGSTFRLSASILLPSESRVEIIPPTHFTGVIPPDSILEGESPLDLGSVASRLTPEVERTLQELQQTLVSARTLLEDQNLRSAVVETLRAVEQATQRSTRLLTQVEGLVSENRTQVRQLLASAVQATQELKRTLESANALLQDPQLNEDLRATLASARKSAEQAEQILQQANALISDPQLQEDIKATASNVRELSEKANTLAEKASTVIENAETLTRNLNSAIEEGKPIIEQAKGTFERLNSAFDRLVTVRTLGITDATYRLEMNYNSDLERYRTDIFVSLLTRDNRSILLGVYDFTESNRLITQLGMEVAPNLTVRYGLYASKPGIGVDYRLSERGSLSLDLFNPNDWQGSLRFNWRVADRVGIWGGLDSPFRKNQPAFGVRIER